MGEAMKPLKKKWDTDIHTFRELKDGIFGELQQRNYKQLQNSRDAHSQALIFEIAEHNAKMLVQHDGSNEIQRCRQTIAKETLIQNAKAEENFIKIQRESDERKIHDVMTSLGFEMPKLPDEDEEAPEEEKRSY